MIGRGRIKMKTKFKFKESQIICLIILMYSIVIYKFVDSSRALETYFDEMIYYDIAKSIAQGDIFKVHGVSMDFTNIAYSLVISPFCLISDTVLRIHLISYLNALLMSISIYPIWLICKELNVKKEISWLIVSIVMVYPGMLISKTFMSENLYWPLTLFTYYYIIKMIKYRKLSYSIISGVLAYFCYLCKEVGLCIILATIAFMILDPIDSYLYENNKEKVLSNVCLINLIGKIVWLLQ